MKTRTDQFRTQRLAVILLALALAGAMLGQLLIKWGAASAAWQTPPPFVVTTNADENDGTPDPGFGSGTSLREAIEAANNSPGDDTINFHPDVTGQSFLSSPLPALNSNLVINGPGANVFAMRRLTGDDDGRGSTNFRIFTVNAGKTVSISGLTISGGSEVNGGGIANFGNLTVNGLAVSGNTATSGGGIFNGSGATLVVNNSTVSSNTSGGGIFNQGTLTLSNSTLANNTATGSGGGVGSSGALTIRNSTIAGNTAGTGGGVSSSGTFILSSTILAKNSAGSGPDASGTINSAGYSLIQNTSGWSIITTSGPNLTGVDPLLKLNGGAPLLADNGGPTLTIALLPGSPAIDQGLSNGLTTDQRGKPRILDNPGVANPAGGDGADIGALENETALLRVTTLADHNDGSCNSTDCTLREAINTGNAATIPVEIDFAPSVLGTINLGSSLAALNNEIKITGPGANLLSVRRNAGGNYRIFTVNSGKTVTISGLTVTNGNETNGGGIANSGNLTVSGLAIAGNTAVSGGGLHNNTGATLTVNTSTISGNTASGGGGGVSNAGTLTVANSTSANNVASGNGGGFDNSGSLTVNNSTIAGNTANNGGGISSTGTLNLSSTIVAANSASSNPDVSGVIAGAGFNLLQTTAGWSITTDEGNNQSGVNPLFELGTDSKPLLKNNGGPTQTIALLCGSPAIDAGTSNGFASEQRGLLRTFNDPDKVNASDSTDIGAFERQQPCNAVPVASCKANVTIAAVDGCEAVVNPQDLNNGSFDPEGDPIQLFVDTGVLPVGGPQTVRLSVVDDRENVASCTSQVTVVETIPPVASCQTTTVFLDSTGQAKVLARDVDNGSSDNCGVARLTVTPNVFTCANLGSNTVTLTVKDTSGNEATCTTTVNVAIANAPQITCPADITVNNDPGQCSALVNPGMPTVGGDCSGTTAVTATRSDAQPLSAAFPIGTTTITWKATNSLGNMATCEQKITVKDTEKPVITCPANIVALLPANTPDISMPVAFVVNATDNCPGVSLTTTKASGSIFPLGTTTVTATATDAKGNVSTCSFTVTVLYRFTGFFSPIDNLPVVNEVKAGQSIPIKFSLSGNKGLNIFATGSPASGVIVCNSSAPITVIEETETPGNSGLSYSPGSDQYQINWKTEKEWAGTCRQLVVQLNDGSIHRANFKFK